jgi:hypothetical protein
MASHQYRVQIPLCVQWMNCTALAESPWTSRSASGARHTTE